MHKKESKLVVRYLDFIFKYYKIILVLYIFSMLFLIFKSTSIRIDSNLYALFPQKLDSIQNMYKMDDYYGGNSNTTVTIKFKNPDNLFLAASYRYNSFQMDILSKLNSVVDKYLDDDKIGEEDLNKIKDEYSDYNENIYNLFVTLQEDLKKENGKNKKYTQLFLKEYDTYVYPDLTKCYKVFIENPINSNLKKLVYAFNENQTGIKKYQKAVTKHLPADREKILTDFVELFSQNMKKYKDVLYIDYKINQKFIEDHLLYLIDTPDIDYIDGELRKRIDFERRKNILSSSIFVDEDSGDLNFQVLKDRYVNTGADNFSHKFIRLQNPDSVFDGNNSNKESQYYLSEQKDSIFLSIRVMKGSINIDYAQHIIEIIENVFAKNQIKDARFQNLELIQTGFYKDRTTDVKILSHDISRITPIALFVLCFIISFYFKSFLAVPIIFFPLLSDMMCALGFVSIVYGYLNIVSSFLVALIAGLGVNFGTHLLSRYLEAKGKGKSVRECLHEIYTTIFLSNVTATTTTAAGFFVLSLCSFQGFREFGLIAGIGMLSLLFGIVIAFPSFIIFLESFNLVRIKPREYKKLVEFKGKPFPFFKLISIAGIVFFIFSIAHIKDLNFNANFKELVNKPTSVPSPQKLYQIEAQEYLKLSAGLGISPIYAPTLKTYRELTQFLLTENFKNPKYRIESLFLYNPVDQDEKVKHIDLLKETMKSDLLNINDDEKVQKKIDFLKRISQTPPVSNINEIPNSIQNLFLGKKPGYFILFYNISAIKSIPIIENSYSDFQKINNTFSKKGVFVSSDTWIFGDLLHILKKEGRMLVLAIIIIFTILLYNDFRSMKIVLMSLIPLVAGFTFFIGFYYLFNLELNFFNVLMLPVVAGLGLDYGVHSIHRIREEGVNNLAFVFRTTGRTMWIAASQDMVGMTVLTTALYHGLVTIGQLLITGIFCCLLCGSLLLPSIIQWNVERKKYGFIRSLFSWDGLLPQKCIDYLHRKDHKNTDNNPTF